MYGLVCVQLLSILHSACCKVGHYQALVSGRQQKSKPGQEQVVSIPLWTSSNAADGKGTHGHILLHREIHAAVAGSHELVCIAQLAGDGSSTPQVCVSEAHASHILMQP